MKIRNGFVSNSSSSSFVVCFKKVPKTADELRTMLFGKEHRYNSPYEEKFWPTTEVAELVFSQMTKPLKTKEIEEELSNGWLPGMPSLRDFEKKEKDGKTWSYDWDGYNKAHKEFAHSCWERFSKKVGKGTFYVFSYSDNDGDFQSALEHGDLFKSLPHICISHH